MTRVLFYDEGAQGETQLGGGQYKALSVMERLSSEFEPVLLTSTDGELADAARQRSIPIRIRDVTGHLDRLTRSETTTNLWGGVALGVKIPRAVRNLRQYVREIDPDIIHPNENLARLLTALGCWRSDRATITFVDCLWNQTLVDPVMRSVFVRSYDRLVAVSEAAASVFGNGHERPPNVLTVYPGIELDRFEGVSSPERPFPNLTGQTVLTAVGSLKPVKGHKYLLEALPKVDQQDLLCLVVGSGHRREALEAHAHALGIQNQVEFLGHRSDVPAILARSDIAALPSVSEAFGRAALEAMASSLPIVASDVGGLPEVVIDGETGHLIPPRDPDALAKAVQRLITDAGYREQLGRRGRERVVSEFSFDKGVRELQAVYREVLSTK